jgi:hypothetical protein
MTARETLPTAALAGLAAALVAYGAWPTSPETATATELVLDAPDARVYALALAAGPAPDAGMDLPPGYQLRRIISTRETPRGELADGLTVCIGPDCDWPAAVALPGSTGCERLSTETGEWEPAPPCVYLAPSQWRGDCARQPSADAEEIGVGSATPVECRAHSE